MDYSNIINGKEIANNLRAERNRKKWHKKMLQES